MKIKATTQDGRVLELWPRDPLGDVNKPMSDGDVQAKFTRTVEPVYGKEKRACVLDGWWNVKDASAEKLGGTNNDA